MISIFSVFFVPVQYKVCLWSQDDWVLWYSLAYTAFTH